MTTEKLYLPSALRKVNLPLVAETDLQHPSIKVESLQWTTASSGAGACEGSKQTALFCIGKEIV